MLSSITPLGERGRGTIWSITVTFFVMASIIGGGAIGSIGGAIGGGLDIEPVLGAAVLAILTLLGAAADYGLWGLRVPSTTRQVDRHWLDYYKGWVYGSGYGFQLGFSVVTVVNASAIYLVLAACVLVGDLQAGIVMGCILGLGKGLTLLLGREITSPTALYDLHRSMSRAYPGIRTASLLIQTTVGVGLLALVALRP